jgi:hypothetical protein
MLLFRSEEHVERWCESWRMPRGASLTLPNAWKLAQVWFDADRGKPEWRRFTLEETEAIFARLGLTGDFWSLR